MQLEETSSFETPQRRQIEESSFEARLTNCFCIPSNQQSFLKNDYNESSMRNTNKKASKKMFSLTCCEHKKLLVSPFSNHRIAISSLTLLQSTCYGNDKGDLSSYNRESRRNTRIKLQSEHPNQKQQLDKIPKMKSKRTTYPKMLKVETKWTANHVCFCLIVLESWLQQLEQNMNVLARAHRHRQRATQEIVSKASTQPIDFKYLCLKIPTPQYLKVRRRTFL